MQYLKCDESCTKISTMQGRWSNQDSKQEKAGKWEVKSNTIFVFLSPPPRACACVIHSGVEDHVVIHDYQLYSPA